MKNIFLKFRSSAIKKKFYFFLFLLFIPLVVEGFALDPLKVVLESVSGQTNPFFAVFALCFFVLFIGAAALTLTSVLLQQAIEMSPEALTVLTGEASTMIQGGWSFTAGIANMMLLIAFIIIAIAIILGTESFGLKKALPRLIIVAFLINFTLLFVGMGIDISNFLFNSVAVHFAQEGENMFLKALDPLLNLSTQLFWGFVAISGGMYALSASVIGAAAVHFFWVTGAGLLVLLPYILQMLVTGLISLALAGVFFLFFFILIARIFIIQILAILSPIAFLCLIFPNVTKKYWDMWLHHLVQWLFAGVALIFFMYLGIALAPLIETMGDPLTEDMHFMFDWWIGGLLSQIILLIYFLVILGLVRKFVPELANAAIASVKQGVKAVSPYAQTTGNLIKSDFFKHRREALSAREENDPGFKDKIQEEMSAQAPKDAHRLTKPFHDLNAFRKRAAAKARYGTPADAGKEEKSEEEKRMEKSGDNEIANAFQKHIDNKDWSKALGAMAAANKNGVDLSKELGGIEKSLYKQLQNEAKLIGAVKDLKQGAFVESIIDIKSDSSLSEKEKQLKINDAVVKMDKDSIKAIQGSLIEGSKSNDTERRDASRDVLKAMAQEKEKINPLISAGGSNVVGAYSSMIGEGYASQDVEEKTAAKELEETLLKSTEKTIGNKMIKEELKSLRNTSNQT